MKGKDLRRLIGALMIGAAHANDYKIESVWQKTKKQEIYLTCCRTAQETSIRPTRIGTTLGFPDALQAATKIAAEDARAQWTMYDNLNQ